MSPSLSYFRSELLSKAERHVAKLLTEKLPHDRYFHDLLHAKNVVDKTFILCLSNGLSFDQVEIVLLSAWFHDVGYINGNLNHEENSVQLFIEFISDTNYSGKDLVISLILATKIPTNPTTISEMILCDADLSHLGSSEYFLWSNLLRKEFTAINQQTISSIEWNSKNIEFFKSHRYYTASARQLWDRQKQVNLEVLLSNLI